MNKANVIKMAAAISAMPRWVTALILADGASFPWFETTTWKIVSIVSAMAFAIVETYAAAYIMAAWRTAQKRPKKVLNALWVSVLVILAAIMAPAIYVNTFHASFNDFSEGFQFTWSLFVAVSTFLIIGGVGYAENFMLAPKVVKSVPDAVDRIQILASRNSDKFNKFLRTSDALTPSGIAEKYGVSLSTAYSWQNRKLAVINN